LKFQFVKLGPIAIGVDTSIGGGGGPTHRNDFTWELGIPVSLVLGDIIHFTAHPYMQLYSDRNCPTVDDVAKDRNDEGEPTCKAWDVAGGQPRKLQTGFQNPGQDPRNRFTSARLMLQAVLEISLGEHVSLFLILEGDPIGERKSLSSMF